MEVLDDKIRAFIDVGSRFDSGEGYDNGDGHGDGKGYSRGSNYSDGWGFGAGNGVGNGTGNCTGFGEGYGTNYGCGFGESILEINGHKVWQVDCTPTIITNIKGNIAQGYTISHNVKLVPCYIARVGNYLAHGDTAHDALQAAQEKYEEDRPLSERIADTVAKYPTLDTVVPHSELYTLHHTLTGSCKFGRDKFAANHGLDPKQGEMTIRQFINLTMDAYGSDAIKELLKVYETQQNA